jgi:PadR family transcriptional regulator, regulatory protein PadR
VAEGPRFSTQTLSVLAALCAEPAGWRHGYGIAKDTGLKSGSLYPILIRLAERGLVEACWEEEQPAGRPRRHLYRLTPGGLVQAEVALAEAGWLKDRRVAAAARKGGRRVAPEGA